MRILYHLTWFCLLILPGIFSALCHKTSVTIDIDSIFNFWASLNMSAVIDGIGNETMSFDNIILFGDASGSFGSFHLLLGDSNGGMNFSYEGNVPLYDDSFFSVSFLEEDNPSKINMTFDNMFRQLEEIFEEFKGIAVITQRENIAPGVRPAYRI